MKKTSNDSKWRLFLAIILLIVFIIGASLIQSLNGKTTITTFESEFESTESIVCTSNRVEYPMFDYNYSDSQSLKINSVFGNDNLKSISVIYKLGIEDAEALKYSEARNHALMNKSFENDGLQPDSFNSKYGILKNELQFSIYIENKNLNSKTLKYVMLDQLVDNKGLTKEKIIKAYANQGLDCK